MIFGEDNGRIRFLGECVSLLIGDNNAMSIANQFGVNVGWKCGVA